MKNYGSLQRVIAILLALFSLILAFGLNHEYREMTDREFQNFIKDSNYSIYDNAETGQKTAVQTFLGVPLKYINIKLIEDRKVYLGGYPIGLNLSLDGVVIESIGDIETEFGGKNLSKYFIVGDVIKKVDDTEIHTPKDIMISVKQDGSPLNIAIIREGIEMTLNVKPLLDIYSDTYKLGLWVKDSALGAGTVTFIKSDGSFGCLGHPICASDGEIISVKGGETYDCNIIGVNKGARGKPGELKVAIENINKPTGSIKSNNQFGVYGKLNSFDTKNIIQVGGRHSVTMGKAKIYTTVDQKSDFYDIEILKTSHQNSKNSKGIILRITDSRLLKATGGIVQGMSGSPIIQNGNLVGAVTHVFVNDPTKGYGIYLDWMYDN